MIKELVEKARQVEMDTFKKYGVYEKRPIEECWEKTCKAPIGVKWVDTNKGDAVNPEYRCRLVATEIKHDKRNLFAATPPLEAKRNLFSLGANMEGMCLDFIDVVRAYFHAKARSGAVSRGLRRRHLWIVEKKEPCTARGTQRRTTWSAWRRLR